MAQETVEISAERLKQLEELEARLPLMIDDAVKNYKMNKLKLLHEKDRMNPEAANMRARRYAERHRDEINAKRREKRRMAKEGTEGAAPSEKLAAREAPNGKTVRRNSKKLDSVTSSPTIPPLPPPEITESGITVRFDI